MVSYAVKIWTEFVFRNLIMLSCTVQLAADIIMQINVLVSVTACILVPLKCTLHSYSRAVLYLFAAWMIIGLIGSFLFILVQLILIIDFSHAWNGAWLDGYDDSQNKCWLVGKQLLPAAITKAIILRQFILMTLCFKLHWEF